MDLWDAFERRLEQDLALLAAIGVDLRGRPQRGWVPDPLRPLEVTAALTALNLPDPSTRASAAEELGRLGEPRALGPLEEALNDSDDSVVIAAAHALACFGKRAIPALAGSGDAGPLRHRSRSVRAAVTHALERVGWTPARGSERVWAAVGRLDWPAVTAEGADAVGPVLWLLHDPDDEVRRGAAWALGVLGDPGTFEAMAALFEDFAPEVRSAARHALVACWPASRPVLLAALRHPSAETRMEAAAALASAGWLATDADERIWDAVARELWCAAAAEGESAVEPLIAALPRTSSSAPNGAAEALVGLGASAVAGLLRALRHPHPGVRRSAAEALGRIGRREALPALRARLRILGGEPDAVVSETLRAAIRRIEESTRDLNGLPQAADPTPPPERLPRAAGCIRLRC